MIHRQMYSLALGYTTFGVAGSTIHASACKGHWDTWLNGCRSKKPGIHGINNNITHFTQSTQGQPSRSEEDGGRV